MVHRLQSFKSFQDEVQSGRSAEAMSEDSCQAEENSAVDNRRTNVHLKVASLVGISTGSVKTILRLHLAPTNVCV